MNRRDFLKISIASMVPLIVPVPLRLFTPPREPFVKLGLYALDGLYSHLGVLPSTRELSICEGKLLEIGKWDGNGYPCLVENACVMGSNKPQAWIYDFDLWNFRHDDDLGPMWKHPEGKKFNSHNAWYASRRFGVDTKKIVSNGNGFLSRQMYRNLVRAA
jgi:hypothetical protein